MATTPKLVEELQAGLAAKLNAIPALPADVNPKLARPGFERGFQAGLLDAKLAAVVVDLATNVALALSGDLAILAEQAGATALRGAIARFKSMPVFLPATTGAGGGFVRLPQAATAAGEAAGAKAAQAEGAAAGASRGGLPKNPDNLLKQGYKETSHPKAVESGHRSFEHPETGDVLRFDKGRPGAPGHAGKDHYHRENPHKTCTGDACLDRFGNPTPKGSDASHLYPDK